MANNCKIFTPIEYVQELLDTMNFGNQLYGKRILENSCGDGQILIEIVRRYIVSCTKMGKSKREIKTGLERDICGVELEHQHVLNCKKNLDEVAAADGIYYVNWNIIEGNYLETYLNRKFQFIIGNPPYIVYRDIEPEERALLRKNFSSCSRGKFDYYYAFIEKSVNDLEDNGLMAYIIPNSIYKNVFAQQLRELIKPYLTKVWDYTYQNKFSEATTSSTILQLKKHQSKSFSYIDVMNQKEIIINKSLLQKKWIFEGQDEKKERFCFGEYYQVNNTIATLCNDAFLLENYEEDSEYYILPNGDKIERTLVKPAMSRKKRKNLGKMAIIFPYYIKKSRLTHYEDNEFRKKFPYATEHLKRFEKRLTKRAADKKAKWFEYGRSQAITKIFQRKIVMPSILASRIRVSIVDENTIPCAGFFITSRGEYSLEQGKKILESTEFYQYLEKIGIYTTGKSRRLTVKDIAGYTFDSWE